MPVYTHGSVLTTESDRLVPGVLEQSFRAFVTTLGVRRNAKPRCMVQQVRFDIHKHSLVAHIDNLNREIKFGSLLQRLPIISTGSTWFATGHYARKSWANGLDGLLRPQLLRGLDSTKDQSYYLSSISESGLRRALFPLGGLHKSEVRSLAKQYELLTSDRPESMGICFVGEKARFTQFLCERAILSYSHLLVDIFQPRIFAQTLARSLTRQQAR